MIALQALIKYSDMAVSGEDIDMTCILTSEVSEKFRFEHRFLPHNALVQQEVKVSISNKSSWFVLTSNPTPKPVFVVIFFFPGSDAVLICYSRSRHKPVL